MIARGAVLALVLLIVLLLQTVVAPDLTLAGVTPDLVVLSVLVIGLLEGPETGLRYGFAAGLATDLLSSSDTILGVTALLLLFLGYAAGVVRPYVTGNERIGRILAAAAGAALLVVGEGLLGTVLGVDGPGALSVLGQAVGAALWAVLFTPLLVAALRRAFAALPKLLSVE